MTSHMNGRNSCTFIPLSSNRKGAFIFQQAYPYNIMEFQGAAPTARCVSATGCQTVACFLTLPSNHCAYAYTLLHGFCLIESNEANASYWPPSLRPTPCLVHHPMQSSGDIVLLSHHLRCSVCRDCASLLVARGSDSVYSVLVLQSSPAVVNSRTCTVYGNGAVRSTE